MAQTFYTDSKEIHDLMKQIVSELKIKHLSELETKSDVSVYLFDNLFEPSGRLPEVTWHSSELLKHRPDWRGPILDLLRRNENGDKLYLFCGKWSQVLYREDKDDFRFIDSRPPIMNDDRTCLIAGGKKVVYMMREEIADLVEPIRFGLAMASRLLGDSEDIHIKSLFTYSPGSYRELCWKLEQLMSDVMQQRDMWKDRFYFYALSVNNNELCNDCKEEMRQKFYIKGDEEAALKWRPGTGACNWPNCKGFSWPSFEEEYSDEYMHECKKEEWEGFCSDEN